MCFTQRYCYFFFVALIITAAAAGAFQYTSYERRRNVSGLSRKCGSDIYAVDTTITSLSATLQPRFQYVAKTTESFKFADLYWLQANVMAYSENSESTVEKLAFHRPTASLLLGYNKTSSSSSDHQELPFPSDRVQYVGRVIASGVNAQELLASIRATSTCNCFWTLDYDTFEPLTGRQFTTSMLMCAVSRHLSGEPLLGRNDSDDATISYLLVESSSKLYLIEKLSVNNQMHEMYQDDVSRFRQEWSRRPFQYSGAVNIEIAITVIDMLQRLQPKNREDLKDNRRIRVLDPTVGSGTFLATAAKLWNSRKNDGNGSLDIVGIDSNCKCSEGTIHNLRKLFGVECIAEEEEFIGKSWAFNNSKSGMDSRVTIYCGDSVELISSTSLDGALFDCVVSNLPWNRNTYEYKQDTGSCTRSEIMRRLPEVLKPGKPVIVVSGSNDLTDSFNAKCSLLSMGFSVIGEVTIPPAGFSLPDSVKNKKKSIEATRPAKRNSDCVVTVAIAPKH